VVRFGSGRNKFVQLLIRSQNSSGRFVQSLLQPFNKQTVNLHFTSHAAKSIFLEFKRTRKHVTKDYGQQCAHTCAVG